MKFTPSLVAALLVLAATGCAAPAATTPEPITTVVGSPVPTIVGTPVPSASATPNEIAAPTPTPAPQCEEDEPCWDCATMGNKVCGLDQETATLDAWDAMANVPSVMDLRPYCVTYSHTLYYLPEVLEPYTVILPSRVYANTFHVFRWTAKAVSLPLNTTPHSSNTVQTTQSGPEPVFTPVPAPASSPAPSPETPEPTPAPTRDPRCDDLKPGDAWAGVGLTCGLDKKGA